MQGGEEEVQRFRMMTDWQLCGTDRWMLHAVMLCYSLHTHPSYRYSKLVEEGICCSQGLSHAAIVPQVEGIFGGSRCDCASDASARVFQAQLCTAPRWRGRSADFDERRPSARRSDGGGSVSPSNLQYPIRGRQVLRVIRAVCPMHAPPEPHPSNHAIPSHCLPMPSGCCVSPSLSLLLTRPPSLPAWLDSPR